MSALQRPRSAIATLAMMLTAAACASHSQVDMVSPPPPEATSSHPIATGASGSAVATPAPPPPSEPPPPPPPPKLNVLVITVDAMRADMPWAGYPRDIAPRLTALESSSVSYTRSYAISSYTAMSIGGLLSGRYPSEMDRCGWFFNVVPDSELLFPELLQQGGIRTFAAHAHWYFDKKSGFRQGFDVYRMVEGIKKDNTTDRNITSPRHLEIALELLSDPQNTAGQFFGWFHFMDPHDMYMTHDGFPSFGKRARDRYDGEMYFTDHHIGKLLDFIAGQPWGDRTAVIVHGDHGEGFGEHGRWRHGFEIWEPLVHVPLFLKVPGVEARRIDTPRSHIDLAPTIAELLGIAPHPDWQGASLLPEMRGEVQPEERDVIVDLPRTSDNDRRRALIHGRHKLMSFGDDFRFKLFDLIDDPKELKDLRRIDKPTFERMRERYQKRIKTIKDICPRMRHKLRGRHRTRPC